MKVIFFLLLIHLGNLAMSQENRSAKQLATENIQEYLATKLFPSIPFKAKTYGELKKYISSSKTNIEWTLGLDFVILEKRNGKVEEITFGFLFYLDRWMNVKLAEKYVAN
jgi:hypothetical protein